ncbi:hypothetical protein [Streptomyces sp. NPDC097619]|uniref:hypothetical protein n=1 Tax=Streptomyces sp. NPDC097619 TaxID=3157228 RepID=UPI00332BC62C
MTPRTSTLPTAFPPAAPGTTAPGPSGVPVARPTGDPGREGPTAPASTLPGAARVRWTDPFCSEGANCFRFGRDDDGRAYIGTTGSPVFVTDSIEALRALVSAVKAGAADHLLS